MLTESSIIPLKIMTTFNNHHIALYRYYDGIKIATLNGLMRTITHKNVIAGTHYMMYDNNIAIKVNQNSYPDVKRTSFI